MRSQPLPAAYSRTAVSTDAATSSSRIPVCRHAVAFNRAAVGRCTAVYSRSVARCRSTVYERAAAGCRLAVSYRSARRCRSMVYRYLTTHHPANINPPSSLVQLTKQVRFILTWLNRTMRHINCRTTGLETVTQLDSGEIGVAAAQARRMPNGKPDRGGCSAGGIADDCERSAALGRKERTGLPLRQGASEAAVQRTGGRTYQLDDKPYVLQKGSRVAEERRSEQQVDMTRRQCHRIRQGRIPEASAQPSSAKAGHRSRSPNEGDTEDASVNLDARHPVGYGLTSAVPTLRSSSEPEYSDQGSDGDVDDVAVRRQKRRQMKPTRRQCHRIWPGMISEVSAHPSSTMAEHSIRSPEEDEPGDALVNLDATHQVGRGLVSEVLTLRGSARAECSYQRVDNGEGGIRRVNMIRVHREQEDERKEPKFGESRAAPLQGADSGRPSGSSEVRGMGQERRMGPGGAHHRDDHGPSMFPQNQDSPGVPYFVTSSGERYSRTKILYIFIL